MTRMAPLDGQVQSQPLMTSRILATGSPVVPPSSPRPRVNPKRLIEGEAAGLVGRPHFQEYGLAYLAGFAASR